MLRLSLALRKQPGSRRSGVAMTNGSRRDNRINRLRSMRLAKDGAAVAGRRAKATVRLKALAKGIGRRLSPLVVRWLQRRQRVRP